MLTKKGVETRLRNNEGVKARVATLRLAERINPKFQNPHVVGGYLRNTILGAEPNDCDVIFQGFQLNQPGITEAVYSAEEKLGIEHYPNWEFENISATGYSGDLYEDVIGKYAFHTDYLTMILMDTKSNLYIGEVEKTLHDFENRVYDLRFCGVEMWANHRAKGRSYASCLIGDLTRGMYLCQSLNLTPSPIAEFLMSNYDSLFSKLDEENQEARRRYWLRKTKGERIYQKILDRFGITSLKTFSGGR